MMLFTVLMAVMLAAVYSSGILISEDMVPNQYHSLEEFLDGVDMVVVMVGHKEIKENMDKLRGKVVLDTRHICGLDKVYQL